MLGHYRYIKVVRHLGVILLTLALVGVTQAQDRREQVRQRRAQATRHVPQRRHAPAAQAPQPARRQAATNRPTRQPAPPRANTRTSQPARSRLQISRPTMRTSPARPSQRMLSQLQSRSSATARPSITPQRPSATGSASQRVESLRRSFRSRSQANIGRYVIDNSRFRTTTPSSSVQIDRSRSSSIFSNPRASQPLNTRNPSALLGRRDTETPRVNTSTTSPRTGIQDSQRNRRRSVTLFQSRNEQNTAERQGTTNTGVVQRDRSVIPSREGSDLLQRLRQGRSRAQASAGIRRYEPIRPGTRQRTPQVRTNQRHWQNRTRTPRQRVLVDASYHRQQARQFGFIRHYPRTIVYHDRFGQIDHSSSYFHVYSRHNRLFHQIVWPSFHFCVSYGHGSRLLFRYVYPHYHRKYVFVSLGGYWPGYDDCLRYYWYGWHPYHWYGYDPIPRQVNNYYTYNYYDEEPGVNTEALDNLEPSPPPPYEGPGDEYFEQGVVAFEDSDYLVAANLFRQVMQLDPNDIIVPFAYTQALFAEKEYLLAVMALRGALDKIDPNNQTIFYPRGLYADDETLFGQIDELMSASDSNPQDRNLKLLLGYHLLGIGEIDSAAGYLEQAGRDPKNAQSAKLLLDLIQTVRQGPVDAEVSEIEP